MVNQVAGISDRTKRIEATRAAQELGLSESIVLKVSEGSVKNQSISSLIGAIIVSTIESGLNPPGIPRSRRIKIRANRSQRETIAHIALGALAGGVVAIPLGLSTVVAALAGASAAGSAEAFSSFFRAVREQRAEGRQVFRSFEEAFTEGRRSR